MSAIPNLPTGCAPRRAMSLGLVACFVGSVAASAATPWRGRPPTVLTIMSGYAANAVATDTLRPSERIFLEKAAELSRAQMQLAQLAVNAATSSDVRTYAQQLVSDHRQINDSVDALRRRKGALVETKPVDVVSSGFQRLAEKSGADFERELVRVIAEREAAALTLFEQVMIDATDSEVRDLAGTYLPLLRDHQNHATELRKTIG